METQKQQKAGGGGDPNVPQSQFDSKEFDRNDFQT